MHFQSGPQRTSRRPAGVAPQTGAATLHTAMPNGRRMNPNDSTDDFIMSMHFSTIIDTRVGGYDSLSIMLAAAPSNDRLPEVLHFRLSVTGSPACGQLHDARPAFGQRARLRFSRRLPD